MIKKSNACLRATRNMLKQMKESGYLKMVLMSTQPPWNFPRKYTGFFHQSATNRLSTHSLLTYSYLACVWLACFWPLSLQGMSGQGCPAKENKHFQELVALWLSNKPLSVTLPTLQGIKPSPPLWYQLVARPLGFLPQPSLTEAPPGFSSTAKASLPAIAGRQVKKLCSKFETVFKNPDIY